MIKQTLSTVWTEKHHICDIHSHILPGIDDGAKDWNTTLEMLKRSYEAGVFCVFATPHFLPWKKNVSVETIRALCIESMQRFYEKFSEKIQVLPGNELYYYSDILEDLSAGRAATLAGSQYVLMEFPEDIYMSDLMTAAVKFKRSSYKMIVAHFERYSCLREADNLERFLATGVELQSNIGEMQAGLFSRNKKWLKKRYDAEDVHFVGSDMHNLTSRPPISKESLQWFRKHLDNVYFWDVFQNNAQRVIRF